MICLAFPEGIYLELLLLLFPSWIPSDIRVVNFCEAIEATASGKNFRMRNPENEELERFRE